MVRVYFSSFFFFAFLISFTGDSDCVSLASAVLAAACSWSSVRIGAFSR